MARSATLCLAVLLALFEIGASLKCYQCNSQTDPKCGDPFDGNPNKLVDCASNAVMQYNKDYLYGILPHDVFGSTVGAFKACHKVVMGSGTVVRSCIDANPTVLNETCRRMEQFTQTELPAKKVASCVACDKDNCNGASSLTFSLPLAFLALIATYLMCKQ